MTTFLAGVQRLHRELRRTTAAPTAIVGAAEINARLFDWYADAWRDLQSERDWRWMRATLDSPLTIGQQTYTSTDLLASRFGRWRAEDEDYCPLVYISGSPNGAWPLLFTQLDQFRQQYVYRTWGASTPIAWTIDENERLLLGPQPAVAYQLRVGYWKEPSELTADNDTPDLPSRFVLLPMWRALMEAARSSAAPEVLDRAQENYAKLHSALMQDQARMPYL